MNELEEKPVQEMSAEEFLNEIVMKQKDEIENLKTENLELKQVIKILKESEDNND